MRLSRLPPGLAAQHGAAIEACGAGRTGDVERGHMLGLPKACGGAGQNSPTAKEHQP
jgi:hypothetical protein